MRQRIRRLDGSTASRIQSNIHVNSIEQGIVVELVQNALDAGATVVDILIAKTSLSLLVADNGSGIAPVDFDLIASRHATSKDILSGSSQLYGFRGQGGN